MNFVWSILVSLILLFWFQLLRTRYRKGLRHIPGPLVASFSNLWKVIAVHNGDMPRRNMAVHKKYGRVVRIGPKHVSFENPQAFFTIHGSRQAYAKVARCYYIDVFALQPELILCLTVRLL